MFLIATILRAVIDWVGVGLLVAKENPVFHFLLIKAYKKSVTELEAMLSSCVNLKSEV